MGKGTSDCLEPGISALSFSMPSSNMLTNQPAFSSQLSAVAVPPSPDEWKILLSSWAAPWESLSPAIQDALWETIPPIHNLVYANPSTSHGKCDRYCELLAVALSQRGFPVKAVSGFYSFEPGISQQAAEQMAEDGQLPWEVVEDGNHTWLEIEGVLIDPTAAQFVDPEAWQGYFDDVRPWSLDNYQGLSEHHGPFPDNWFIQQGWQDLESFTYRPDWHRRW